VVRKRSVRIPCRIGIDCATVRYRRLGHSGLEVSEIGLGSWLTFGSKLDSHTSRQIVHRAFDLGVNLFDTADVYADGGAELALGSALEGLPRRHLVIASKCFFPASQRANDRGLSRKHLFESVEESLRRLRVDYLDLHQCHRWDPATPLDETVRAYEDLIRQGKILYWGVSQWSSKQIEQACRTAEHHGAYQPVSSQPEYSILRRDLESDVAATCVREGLSQIVFSPLAQGVLSGKYSGDARAAGSRAADAERSGWMRDLLEPAALDRVQSLSAIAKELGVSMAELAIAWCLREPNVASAIVGVTGTGQLEDNVAASGLTIPGPLRAQIDQLFPPPAA
jgi:voltage-dependent potassium channel beta subunit